MVKRSDNLDSVVMAIELLRRIPRKRKVTASELHQQLTDIGIDRDLRTIQRQLDQLCTKFSIEKDDRSKPYGYSWLDDAQALAIPNLTTQESLLLQFAEEHLKNLLPARLMKSMQGFFTQARRDLGSSATDTLAKQWPKKVRVVATNQPLIPPKIEAGVFEAVSDALYNNQWLNVDYKNASGKSTNADVMPLGLALQGPRMYLVCKYRNYDNERSLALHRIHTATASTLTFTRPTDFDLKQYDDDGKFSFGNGEKVQLTFRITLNAGLQLLESPLSLDQKAVDLGDDELEISATVVDSAMLEKWLRGFGDEVWDVRREEIL